MNWQVWLQGLGAAAINGAATAGAQAASSGHVNTATAVTAGIGALLGALLYLAESPIKPASTNVQAMPPVIPPVK